MYSVSHGKMKTTEPGTDLKAEGPLGVASLLVGAWAVPQRPNAWVFDSTCGKTLDELNKLVLSLPATIAPKPIARPRSIGLRCRGCRTVPEEQLLRPIAGERLVLAKRLRRDSERA